MAQTRVSFNKQICKGCTLCIEACPKKLIKISQQINTLGYYPAILRDESECNGCGLCAIMCPDLVITIESEVRDA